MSKLIVVLLLLVVGGYVVYNKSVSPKIAPTETTNADIVQTAKKSGAMIEIKESKHSPGRLVVKAGEVVSVTNMDLMGHTVTSDQVGMFDTGIVSKGATKTFIAPSKPGEYPYHCTPHPSMKGVLIVQ